MEVWRCNRCRQSNNQKCINAIIYHDCGSLSHLMAIAVKLSISLGWQMGVKRLIPVIAARSTRLITIATKLSINLGWKMGVQRLIPLFISSYCRNNESIILFRSKERWIKPWVKINWHLHCKLYKHWWFSGRIFACHAGGPGQCKFCGIVLFLQ